MKLNKMLLTILAICNICTLSVYAQNNDTGINIATEPTIIDVNVPTRLCWILDEDNKNFTPQNFTITNNLANKVILKHVVVTGVNDWNLKQEARFKQNERAVKLTLGSKFDTYEHEVNNYAIDEELSQNDSLTLEFDLLRGEFVDTQVVYSDTSYHFNLIFDYQ